MEKQIILKEIEASQTWQIRHQVMWPDKPIDYVKLDEDKKGMHFGLEVEGKLVSIVSLFVENGEAQFRKFATLEEEQGKGYGSKLLTHLMDAVAELGVTRVWCNARANKTTFYNRFGLKETRNQFSKGGLDYVIMEKRLIH
ncbi:GNAT family N-acetyltransferase [Limibacter armeniacum]|uniref:GNAT family N-acetyltransferase n=1 Tax=Limibacter armeniacum TaxID=466084 RepID=UPI002FE5016D